MKKLLSLRNGNPRIYVLAVLVCSVLSGCITIGPRVQTNHVIAHPGNPVQLLQNKTIKAKTLTKGEVVDVDVGGWVAMPKSHWDVVKEELDK